MSTVVDLSLKVNRAIQGHAAKGRAIEMQQHPASFSRFDGAEAASCRIYPSSTIGR
jgi:hypothetical protein